MLLLLQTHSGMNSFPRNQVKNDHRLGTNMQNDFIIEVNVSS